MAPNKTYIKEVKAKVEAYAKELGCEPTVEYDERTQELYAELWLPNKGAAVRFGLADWQLPQTPTPADVFNLLKNTWEHA